MKGQHAAHGRQGRAARPPAQQVRGRLPRRRGERWALAALLFPLFFLAVIGTGVYLMSHHQMGIFRPAHGTGRMDGDPPPPLAVEWPSRPGGARHA